MNKLINELTLYFKYWALAIVIIFMITVPIVSLTAMSFKYFSLLEWSELSRGVLFIGAFLLAVLKIRENRSERAISRGDCLECKAGK